MLSKRITFNRHLTNIYFPSHLAILPKLTTLSHNTLDPTTHRLLLFAHMIGGSWNIRIDLMKYKFVFFLFYLSGCTHTRDRFVGIYTSERAPSITKQVEPSSQKLVHRQTTVSGRDAIASTSRSTATESAPGPTSSKCSRTNINPGSIRRRSELHKKLESLHQRQSLRSGNLLDRIRQDQTEDLPVIAESA